MTLVEAAGHVANRPSRQCLSGGRPWPCAPARERPRSKMDRIDLAEACGDMPAGLATELFERFIRRTR